MNTVIVIGGTTGIGRAIALAFAAQGDEVHVTGIEPKSEQQAEDVTDRHQLDVRDPAQVERFFAAFPTLDVLVNCAGVIQRDGKEFTPKGFAEVIDINLNGTQRCCHAAHAALKAAGGCIINTASMLSFFGSGHAPAYSASKGGVAQLTRSLAIAWASDGIRVNALAPGWIATDLTAALTQNSERSAELVGRTPMGRWGKPDDLAGPALFLASPGANFITGVLLPVDGGYSSR
ncbi:MULTISPECIES: SDR family NAD(P)-dependent oxidoreductase [Halomonadaceae]|jgi:NAD(P)-dependent dehydrogenase (short-subunit alcohol dehydrogenase family)|uniref:SDR family NAD(P)-dependent oxidoreductase n=1 Tax=Halomonadaceae TaxID=28256 RepID=UPI00110F277C|nr:MULTISPECIES: SDR family oxidoreductase [Halomonas]UEQ03804.1 SDR family oxidoreductase [Halomonas profundus]TMU23081.1 SDR family oxidoreductase [Halomonas sp. ATBC28]CAD5261595.1 2-dehydro-3-deoxy-D-gluconate 5-dehydrogenase [Halomonas sp. 59]CAD5261879.1 2-dehydro-3-deoxy-D-gluconate 5-dehydrogenase [Halomonas sp. 113]CAD5275885.1 2-dehydro-3-deoxy-D-gluconate 5-dehydrogenase [Halomonas sp. I3]